MKPRAGDIVDKLDNAVNFLTARIVWSNVSDIRHNNRVMAYPDVPEFVPIHDAAMIRFEQQAKQSC